MKYLEEMIRMTNLAIHTLVLPLHKAVPRLTKFLMKSHMKKMEKSQQKGRKRKGRTKILPLSKRKEIANAKKLKKYKLFVKNIGKIAQVRKKL